MTGVSQAWHVSFKGLITYPVNSVFFGTNPFCRADSPGCDLRLVKGVRHRRAFDGKKLLMRACRRLQYCAGWSLADFVKDKNLVIYGSFQIKQARSSLSRWMQCSNGLPSGSCGCAEIEWAGLTLLAWRVPRATTINSSFHILKWLCTLGCL